jgi:hypothetical protein
VSGSALLALRNSIGARPGGARRTRRPCPGGEAVAVASATTGVPRRLSSTQQPGACLPPKRL